MSAAKNIVLMGISTVTRLIFGLLTFSVMARFLGPHDFGVFMLWLSIASLITLVTNYGFTPFLLREIGRESNRAVELMSEVLTAKVILSLIVIIFSIIGLFFIENQARCIFIFLLLAMLFDSVTDFLNVGFRATNQFSSETKIATISSFFQFTVIIIALYITKNLIAIAFAFCMSRVLVFALTWIYQRTQLRGLKPVAIVAGIRKIKDCFSYAIDFLLQSLFGLIDNLILNHFIGTSAVAVHQAGLRLVLGGAQMANVLGNVFIPKISLSSKEGNKNELVRNSRNLQAAFLVSGALFGLVLSGAADLIVNLLYGVEYKKLIDLLPWFGFLFYIRFAAASFGIILTSLGYQAYRAKANAIHWLLILIMACFLIEDFENLGWILALTIGNATLMVLYMYKLRKVFFMGYLNLALLGLLGFAFVPFLN